MARVNHIRLAECTRGAGRALLLLAVVGTLVLPPAVAAGESSPGWAAGVAAGEEAAPSGRSDATGTSLAPRILGGVVVDPPGKYPFMVGIVMHGEDSYYGQYCGGSVIGPDWVLTAAHCMVGETAATVDVVIGRHDLTSDEGERIRASRILVHPAYDDTSLENDLALIQLASPTSYAPMLLPADTALEADGTTLTVIGWGDTTNGGREYPEELYEVDLPVVGDAACRIAYAGFDYPGYLLPTEVMICAGNLEAGGVDSCPGDSGGPMFAATANGFVQVGIVSWGNECGLPSFPGVYTRVSAFTTWITNRTGIVPPGAQVTCRGAIATIVGTGAGESIKGTTGPDVIAALGGDDTIDGRGGADLICGGPGNDRILGGQGDDQLWGAEGNDVIAGGPGADVLEGGPGRDVLGGGGGNDQLVGGYGLDTIVGGPDSDTCQGEIPRTCELPAGFRFPSGPVHLAVSDATDAVGEITVSGSGVVTDLNVDLLISHTWVGDLRVTLTHVDTGTRVVLIDRPGLPPETSGCSEKDVDATLDDEAPVAAEGQCRTSGPAIPGPVRPNQSLGAFDGEDLAGTWRLVVSDLAAGDQGFLESWVLHFAA